MQQRYARQCRRSKGSSSTIILLVEADMPDTLLGHQARAGYGGDNERLKSAAACTLCFFKTRRNFLEAKFQEKGQAQRLF